MSLWWWLLWTQPAFPSLDQATVVMQVRCAGHPDGTQHIWEFDANYDIVVPEKAP